MRIKVTPLDRYAGAQYPTRSVLDEHPELLNLLPKRWRKNPVVLSAITAAFILASGYRGIAEPEKTAEKAGKVAPVFQHGTGRAAIGGDMMFPPIFLTEEEARSVINEQAKKAGIHFQADKNTVHNVPILLTDHQQYSNNHPKSKPAKSLKKTKTISLALDGTDAKLGISYEYLSTADYDQIWGEEATSSIVTYDMIPKAKQLVRALPSKGKQQTTAIFYDPLITHKVNIPVKNNDWTAYEAEGKRMEREELRKQVQDFIKWLKSEGII